MARRFGLTADQRVLLFLAGYSGAGENFVAPAELSQKGIGEGVGMLVNNVSRSLARLQSAGLVNHRLAHVRGSERRTRVFQLTSSGQAEASRLSAELGSVPILVRDEGAGQREEKLGSVLRLLWGTGTPDPRGISEVLEWFRDHDVLDLDIMRARIRTKPRGSSSSPGRRPVHYISGSPAVDVFVGRKGEITEMLEVLGSGNPGILMLVGLPGIGKSYLAARVMASLVADRDLFWYRVRPWDGLRSVARAFGEFLGLAERHPFRNSADGRLTPAEILRVILDEMEGMDPVLFIDDAQNSSGDLLTLWELFVEAYRQGRRFGMVFTSREELDIRGGPDTVPGCPVVKMTLGGLDRTEAEELLRDRKDLAGPVFDATGGHPLFLELARRTGKPVSEGEKGDFLARELLPGLDMAERLIMERMCVFSVPVEPGAVLSGGDEAELIRLKGSGLVMSDPEGLLWLHDLVSGPVYGLIPHERRREHHINAAGYLLSVGGGTGTGTLAEAILHLQKGGRTGEAARLVVEYGEALPDEGDTPIIRDILAGVTGEGPGVAPDLLLPLLMAAGRLHEGIGNRTEALALYRDVIAMEPSDGPLKARAYSLIGALRKEMMGWEESIAAFTASIERYAARGDKRGMAEAHLGLGSVYARMGDTTGARKQAMRALELFGGLDDRRGMAAARHNLGSLALGMHRYGTAARELEAAGQLAGECGDGPALALTMELKGHLALERGSGAGAIWTLLGAVDELVSAGEMDEAADMSIRSARRFMAMGRFEEARDILERGLRIEPARGLFSRRKAESAHRRRKATIHGFMATVLRELDDPDACARHRGGAMELHRLAGDTEGLGREVLERALDLEATSRTGEALDAISEAKRNLPSGEGYLTVRFVESRTLARAGRRTEALHILRELRDHEGGRDGDHTGGQARGNHVRMERIRDEIRRLEQTTEE